MELNCFNTHILIHVFMYFNSYSQKLEKFEVWNCMKWLSLTFWTTYNVLQMKQCSKTMDKTFSFPFKTNTRKSRILLTYEQYFFHILLNRIRVWKNGSCKNVNCILYQKKKSWQLKTFFSNLSIKSNAVIHISYTFQFLPICVSVIKRRIRMGTVNLEKKMLLNFFLHFSGERKNRITSFDVSRLNMYIANILNEPKLQSYILDCFIV